MLGDGGWIVRKDGQQRLLRILVLNPKQWVLFGRLVPREFATCAGEAKGQLNARRNLDDSGWSPEAK